MTIDKLRELGHTLVPFEVTQAEFLEMEHVYIAFAKHASMPNIKALTKKRHEYLMPFYRLFVLAASLPNWLLKCATWVLVTCTAERRLAHRARALRSLNHEEVNGLHQRWDAWRMAFDDKWRSAGLDALIAPCQYHCAFKAPEDIDLCTIHDYYYLWNFGHFPAGVVPVTSVSAEEAQGSYIQDTDRRWTDRQAH